jgi:hypothetical protein
LHSVVALREDTAGAQVDVLQQMYL